MNNTTIRFDETAPSEFHIALRKRINAYFKSKSQSKYANRKMNIKIFIIFLMFLSSYGLMILSGNEKTVFLIGSIAFGFTSALIAFNIAHDASHEAISSRKWVNNMFSYSWNLIGVNAYIWNLKHNVSHHSYTNIPGKDMDIQQIKIARLLSSVPLKRIYRFQHIYIPLLYPFVSIFSIFIKDFLMFSTPQFGEKHSTKEYVILIVSKLLYFSYAVVLPFLVVDLPWYFILMGIIFTHLMLGIFLAIILFAVHAQEDSIFPEPDEEGIMKGNWFVHQIVTTSNFAADSRLMFWISGGLNTHIVHHVFPGTCHIHYFDLTKIIRDTAKEYDINFRDKTLVSTVKAHLRFLKIMGTEQCIAPASIS